MATRLLFDFDADDSDHDTSELTMPTQISINWQLLCARLEDLCKPSPSNPFARQLLADVQSLVQRIDWQAAEPLKRLATQLGSLGYDVCLRESTGGGPQCFRSLRHSFLLVRGSGEFSGAELLVEPALRQHFAIPHPTPDYAAALAAAPEVFVGGACRLVPIVQVLCALMADSFDRQGLATPPWRREAAMVSKWCPSPARVHDTWFRAVSSESLPLTSDPHHNFLSATGAFSSGPASPAAAVSPACPSSTGLIAASAGSAKSDTNAPTLPAGATFQPVFRFAGFCAPPQPASSTGREKSTDSVAALHSSCCVGFTSHGSLGSGTEPGSPASHVSLGLLGSLEGSPTAASAALEGTGMCGLPGNAQQIGGGMGACLGLLHARLLQAPSQGVPQPAGRVETRPPTRKGELPIHLVRFSPWGGRAE